MNPQDPLTPIQACFLPHQLAAQRDAEAALARALVPPLTPQGAWAEPGQRTDTSTSTNDNASLPSVEACEKVAGEQQTASDATTNTDSEIIASLPSVEACEKIAGEQLADSDTS